MDKHDKAEAEVEAPPNPLHLLGRWIWRDIRAMVIGGVIGAIIGLAVSVLGLGMLNLGLVGLFAILGAAIAGLVRSLMAGAFF
ncbi:MAG: hypothetical protein AAGM21_13690 [Pseudomonadota bacterium]